ncbi:Integral membrane sensor signal transduction histidine kinase [Syntrophobacter sp. SbD1]|nr:Integral membrane sensor signal transduction histidine kinase [Syntrophobacter sp. SbD1]
MSLSGWLKKLSLLEFPEEGGSPEIYRLLRRRIIILMLVVTVIPLLSMALINSYQYRNTLRQEIVSPLLVLVNKSKHSMELFLAERLSAVSFIGSEHTFEELADQGTLNRIFRVMKQEFGGFVDLGLIDENGVQVSYVGPYDLKGRNYSGQPWFHEVRARGAYTSDVFMGFRRFPHIAMAVQRGVEGGKYWILRATIDTHTIDELIASMRLDPKSDGFLVNREGTLQTATRSYGAVLDHFPIGLPLSSSEPNCIETTDSLGREVLVAYAYFQNSPYALVVVKPRGEIFRSWYKLKSEILYVFLTGVLIILLVVFKLTGFLVERLRESEERREAAFREIEHSQKLSSIGRLAAGVAHEINNPMAIINEKAGLMKDLLELDSEFRNREKFIALTDAIINSVERCRSITHRLLGFARRMEPHIESVDINEVVRETVGFVEKEAGYRNLDLRLELAENLPVVESDRGQLQQVFLNLLSNAFAAVKDKGSIRICTCDCGETLSISVEDNGCGMSEETLSRLYEPFFTTKTKGHGTGLGMFISYGIIKRLGGRLEVRSKEGEGTTMTVHLKV